MREGGRRSFQAAAGEAGSLEVERKRMDYLMIIVPLKLALVVYIAYVLFH